MFFQEKDLNIKYRILYYVVFKSDYLASLFLTIYVKVKSIFNNNYDKTFSIEVISNNDFLVHSKSGNIHIATPYRALFYQRGLNTRLQSLYNSYGFDDYNFVLKKNSIIIDIGVNIGEFSIYCARNKHHVFAIEPDITPYNLLVKNLNNYSNIKCFNLAISNFTGSQYIYLSTLTASTSIIKPNDNNTNRESKSVRGLTLDDFIEKNNIKRVDFLKVDCEGAEPEILEGLKKYRNSIRYFSIDCGAERNGKFTYKEVINSFSKNKNFQLLSKPAYEIKNRVIVKNNNFI
jgi:FkbM family methyltransferase